MLTTLLPPTSGRARVGGYDVVRQGAQVRAVDRGRAPGGGARRDPHRPRTSAPPGHAPGSARRVPPASRPGAARAGRADRGRRPPGRRLLGRDEAPPGSRAGSGPLATDPVSRRADDGPRPPEPRGSLGGGGAAGPRRGHDRVPHDPVPRGGRRARRPDRDHRPRADRRRGNARPAQGRDRQPERRGDARRLGGRRPVGGTARGLWRDAAQRSRYA